MLAQKFFGKIGSQRLLNLGFRLFADDEFLIFNEQRLTRRQVKANIDALGGSLQALGVMPGDRVVTLLPACPEAVYTLFLPQTIGVVNVPLNPLSGERELRHILADSKPRAVITTRRYYGQDNLALLLRMLPDLPALESILVTGIEEGDGKTVYPLSGALMGEHPVRPVNISGDELTLVTYTSGTTGLPKGVMHTPRRNFSLAARAVGPRLDLSLMRCLLLPFPPYQFAGMLGIVIALLSGGKVVLMDRFNPQQMLEYIQAEKVTKLIGSPTIYRLLLSWPGQEKYDLSSLRQASLSTEPCPPDLARALSERLKCSLENVYATTESMLISWTGLDDSWDQAANTVGKPVPGARLRIVDDERRPLPAGERGEIAVQTTQMMTGYYNDPGLTAQVLDSEGWFYTGDIGWLGEDGCLRLVDRKKDMIIRGGQNIFPAEVEAHLSAHSAVRRVAVLGVPHPLAGEQCWAYIVRQPGSNLTIQQVLEHCRGQISPYKIPEQVRFVESLPLTASGKVQKYVLRIAALQEMEHGSKTPTAHI